MTEAVARHWRRFWFEPDHALNLAVARIIVATHALWHLLSRDYAAMAQIPDLWTTVPSMQRWRYLIVIDASGLEPSPQLLRSWGRSQVSTRAFRASWLASCCTTSPRSRPSSGVSNSRRDEA